MMCKTHYARWQFSGWVSGVVLKHKVIFDST